MRNRAPAASAVARISGEPSDVTNPNGVWKPSARRRRSRSMPFMFGHVPVGQDDVGLVGTDGLERLGAVGRLADVPVVAGLAQRADHDLPHHAAVVGDEDADHERFPS